MAPDVKIRNLDDATFERLKARAEEEGSSMESLLRTIVADALGSGGVTAADWEQAGFDEVSEVVPGRLYELAANWRHFRIAITRAIGSRSTKWNSSIDELIEISREVDGHVQRDRVWTNPLGIPDRHLGSSAEMALRDAMHWLSDYAGVDAVSRARNGAQEAARRHPGLVHVVERVGARFAPGAIVTWQGAEIANIGLGNFNFQFSRIHDTVVVNSYLDSGPVAATEQHFRMSTDAWQHIADFVVRLVQPQ